MASDNFSLVQIIPQNDGKQCSWCRLAAKWLLVRISGKDGNKYERPICDKHADEWAERKTENEQIPV